MKLKKNQGKESSEPEVVEVEEAQEVVETVVEPVKEKPPVVEAKATAVEPAVTATIPERQSDFVMFHFTSRIQPPPTIGPFSIGREFNLTYVDVGTELLLPREAALMLLECKKGVIKG